MGLQQEPGRISSATKEGFTQKINEFERDTYILPAPEIRDCDEPVSCSIITEETGLDGTEININLYGEMLSILADANLASPSYYWDQEQDEKKEKKQSRQFTKKRNNKRNK